MQDFADFMDPGRFPGDFEQVALSPMIKPLLDWLLLHYSDTPKTRARQRATVGDHLKALKLSVYRAKVTRVGPQKLLSKNKKPFRIARNGVLSPSSVTLLRPENLLCAASPNPGARHLHAKRNRVQILV